MYPESYRPDSAVGLTCPLTQHGVRQAEVARDYLSRILHPTAVCTSPLSRCVRTGEVLAQPHGLATSPLAGFADIDYGAWQGKSYDEVQAAEPAAFASWRRTPLSPRSRAAKACTRSPCALPG